MVQCVVSHNRYLVAVVLAITRCASAMDNGVAQTPPRGFSTWNAFPVHSIDEATCYSYMNAMVAKGLNAKNYTYFIVDEPCFAGRAADGTLIENKTTWPTGLKKFGEALRAHGMKLGTYTCVGPTTCGGCIASEGHEDQDVATFAEWGVEYLKVDSCSRNCTPAAGIPNKTSCGEILWSRYTTAIKRHKTITGGEMVYSIIGNLAPPRVQPNPPWKWAKDYANSWRTNIDVQSGFGFLSNIIDNQRRMSGNGSWCPSDPENPNGPGYPCAVDGSGACKTCGGPDQYAGIGHWNDMDMLIVGTTTNTNPPFCSNYSNCSNGIRPGQHWTPMSVAQSRAQVSMWTILKSPLLASADFNTVAQEQVDILTNDEVLAVSDDPLGKEAIRLGDQGRVISSTGEIYVGQVQNGGYAVVFFNRKPNVATMTLSAGDVVAAGAADGAGLPESYWTVRDLWTHTDNGTLSINGALQVTVPGTDAVMITLTPAAAAASRTDPTETETEPEPEPEPEPESSPCSCSCWPVKMCSCC